MQTGLYLCYSQTPKTRFLASRPKCKCCFGKICWSTLVIRNLYPNIFYEILILCHNYIYLETLIPQQLVQPAYILWQNHCRNFLLLFFLKLGVWEMFFFLLSRNETTCVFEEAFTHICYVLLSCGQALMCLFQLMKAWGADVTTTCSTDAVELVKSLGADTVIDYRTTDVVKELGKLEKWGPYIQTFAY